MHHVASHLPEHEVFFSPYYADTILNLAKQAGLLECTILGKKWVERSLAYLKSNGLSVDYRGKGNDYDLVVTCQDLIIPKNIRRRKIVLIQEGMTDPETFLFRLVRDFPLIPRWLAGTSATGLSHAYDRFCVASEGYRELFIQKGVRPDKIVVTGIPNFDDCRKFLKNDYPHKHFVLVCTSDLRETLGHEDRKEFIYRAVRIARGRQLIFKLHPNENVERATREISRYAPGSVVHSTGKAEEMVANCNVLITRYSSVAYVGIALGKEVYSDFDPEQLKRLLPIQSGTAASDIADVCKEVLSQEVTSTVPAQRPWTGSLNVRGVFQAISKDTAAEVE